MSTVKSFGVNLKNHSHQTAGGSGSPRKREYDRHDGTGRGHETDKKHGAGKGNWGAIGDEYQEDVHHAMRATLEAEAALDEQGPQRVGQADVATDDKTMTLDEYERRQQEALRA